LNTHWKVRGVHRNPLAKGNKLFGHTLEGGEESLETHKLLGHTLEGGEEFLETHFQR
jgi:hypothetical protein